MNPTVGHCDKKESEAAHSAGYAPYPKLTPEDVAPASVTATTMPPESNPYIIPSPAPAAKSKRDTMRDVLDKFGKRVNETAKKTEDLAGNFWQHLKTGPSITDAAMGRIAQTTKVISEGGYEKIFHQSFETLPGEKLKKSYACYLSTSSGPVMGVLYLSTAKLAFCSDNPLSYKVGDHTQWSYYKITWFLFLDESRKNYKGDSQGNYIDLEYQTARLHKVVIPLHQLRSASPCVSKEKPGEKYVQVVLIDNHEFWFIGFVNYDSAVKHLQEAVQGPPHAHV